MSLTGKEKGRTRSVAGADILWADSPQCCHLVNLAHQGRAANLHGDVVP